MVPMGAPTIEVSLQLYMVHFSILIVDHFENIYCNGQSANNNVSIKLILDNILHINFATDLFAVWSLAYNRVRIIIIYNGWITPTLMENSSYSASN